MGNLKQNNQNGKVRKSFRWTSSRQKGRSQEEKNRVLRRLHLPCPQASAPRDRHLQEIHEHHELFHQRRLREDRLRVFPSRPLQQEAHPLPPRGPGCRPPPPPR